MALNVEIVYLGRNNTIDLRLEADGTAVDLSAVNKITASFDNTLVESEDATGGPIKWSGAGFETGEIRLDLGAEAIPAGRYEEVPIIVYDPTNTNGIQWGDGVPILVKADEEAG